ncbi:hypothetical protein [Streptomyces minutiscleroticus]|uniref:hypothetical protein n=1 Tax=Streptomyces minutiscleroticus TaxID=68238 RepID=UPI00331EA246
MRRGTTARALFPFLAAVLLALQLLAPTASFASAHAPPVASASDSAAPDAGREVVNCGESGHHSGPNGPLRTRDRHRASADSASGAPVRPLLTRDPACGPVPLALVAHDDAHRPSRSSTDRTPAALQVFRC